MYRKFEEKLNNWKQASNKRPLVVLGVRQAGKTYIINKFGHENYNKFVEINLLKDDRLIKICENSTFKQRKELLCATYNIDFLDDGTLLFVDEAQLCPKFITDLKNYCEEGINNIIIAGSLLSITLTDMDEPYPVGKTHIEYLYPMNFEEYLYAINKDNYIPYIIKSFKNNEPCPMHDELMNLFRKYLFLGGMPAVLQNYIDNDMDISKMDNTILKDIKKEYQMDIVKHIKSKKDKLRAQNIYNSIPSQLMKENHKFMYAKMDSNERKSDYITALDWLVNSGMVIIAMALSSHSSELMSGPDIISKGFVYMKESEELINGLKDVVRNTIESYRKQDGNDWKKLKSMIISEAEDYLWKVIKREPLIIPVIISV